MFVDSAKDSQVLLLTTNLAERNDAEDELPAKWRLYSAVSKIPEETKELEKQFRRSTKDKKEAVPAQDFEKVLSSSLSYCVHSPEFFSNRLVLTMTKGKEVSKSETEASKGAMTYFSESDIQHVVY